MVSIDLIRKVKEERELKWMCRDENIVGVDIGQKFVNSSRTPALTIRVLVKTKMEESELEDKQKPIFPKAILLDEASVKNKDFKPEKLFQLSTNKAFNLLNKRDLIAAFIRKKISLSLESVEVKRMRDADQNRWLLVEDGLLVYGVKPAESKKLNVYDVIRTDVIERVFDEKPDAKAPKPGRPKPKRKRRFKDIDKNELRPGLPIGGGTIGAFVKYNNQDVMLTCWHVFNEWEKMRKGRTHNATPTDDRYETLMEEVTVTKLPADTKNQGWQDYVLVQNEKYPKLKVAPEIIGIGPIFGHEKAERAMPVRKFGAATELTHGIIDTIDLTLRLTDGEILKNQIGIVADLTQSDQFCDAGDSGAVVVNNAQEVVGLLGAYAEEGRYGAATKIQEVIDDLEIRDFNIVAEGELDRIINDSVYEALSVGNLLSLGPAARRLLLFTHGCDDCNDS